MAQPKYALWLWEKFGKHLQPMYKRIDDWDVPWLRDVCRGFWGVLDDETKKKIYDFVIVLVKKYGDEFAKNLIKTVLEQLGLDLKND